MGRRVSVSPPMRIGLLELQAQLSSRTHKHSAAKGRVIGTITNYTILNLTGSALPIVPCCKPAYAKTVVLDASTRFLFSGHDDSASSELGFGLGLSG